NTEQLSSSHGLRKNKLLAAFKQLLLAGSGLIETAIGQLKEICQILYTTTSLAKQFLGKPLLRALGLCLQTQTLSHGK
ncbi:MAG: transposase, partial [Candidatus Midichloria sp.]|nr:transposase [Candidatus Midichloria sp.]